MTDLSQSIPPPSRQAGACIGPYEILHAIGSGGTSTVYAAIDTRTKRKVAVKILKSGASPALIDRFSREGPKLRRLERHPHFVHVIDWEAEKEPYYIGLELLTGKSFAQLIREHQTGLPFFYADLYARQIATAIHSAHQEGIYHRDLNVCNVCLGGTPVEPLIIILDFGLAISPEDRRLTPYGHTIGTPSALAPEQLVAEPERDLKRFGILSDVWAYGILVHRIATGRHPFVAFGENPDVQEILTRTMHMMPNISRELPEGFAGIVRKCLERDVDRRYQNFWHIRRDLIGLPRPKLQPKDIPDVAAQPNSDPDTTLEDEPPTSVDPE